jgi:hypothetical protein
MIPCAVPCSPRAAALTSNSQCNKGGHFVGSLLGEALVEVTITPLSVLVWRSRPKPRAKTTVSMLFTVLRAESSSQS